MVDTAPQRSEADGPLVSVIVTTRNSAPTLRRCLESVRSQTYRNVEIVVADNFSTDETVSIAKEYADRTLLVGPERSSQFNAAAKVSKGEFLYRIDSDFVLEPSVVGEAVGICLRGADAVVIANRSDPTVGFWAKVRQLERDCYLDDEAHVAARFFRRDALAAVNGFDDQLVAAEDYDLHSRLIAKGFRIGRTRACEWHIGEPKSLQEVAAKHFYYGTTIGRYVEKNGRAGTGKLLPFRRAYIRHWRDFAAHPVLTLGFLAYLTTKYSSALGGYLSARRRG